MTPREDAVVVEGGTRLDTVIWWSHPGDRDQEPRADLVTPATVRSAFHNKPVGGFWTSPETTEYGWEDWCRDNEPEWLGRRWRLRVAGDPRILVIDSAADLLAAFDRYPMVEERSGYRDSGVDWVAVGADYDAVWLTANGHFATRLSRLTDIEIGTYSWDCDSVFWYRWSFDHVEVSEPVA